MSINISQNRVETDILAIREEASQLIDARRDSYDLQQLGCQDWLTLAESAFAVGDLIFNSGTFSNGSWTFASDPVIQYNAALGHLRSLDACVRAAGEELPQEPREPADPSTPPDQPDLENEPPLDLPTSSSGLRVVAGLAFMALAGYGLWRMSRR